MPGTYDCKICGWTNLRWPHQGAVDCIAAYRAYVEELQALLPKGKQVCLGSIARNSTVRIWIEGPITQFGLERAKRYIEFMQEAYGPDESPARPQPEIIAETAAEE